MMFTRAREVKQRENEAWEFSFILLMCYIHVRLTLIKCVHLIVWFVLINYVKRGAILCFGREREVGNKLMSSILMIIFECKKQVVM